MKAEIDAHVDDGSGLLTKPEVLVLRPSWSAADCDVTVVVGDCAFIVDGDELAQAVLAMVAVQRNAKNP